MGMLLPWCVRENVLFAVLLGRVLACLMHRRRTRTEERADLSIIFVGVRNSANFRESAGAITTNDIFLHRNNI